MRQGIYSLTGVEAKQISRVKHTYIITPSYFAKKRKNANGKKEIYGIDKRF